MSFYGSGSENGEGACNRFWREQIEPVEYFDPNERLAALEDLNVREIDVPIQY